MMFVGQIVKESFSQPVWAILVGQVKDHGVRPVYLQDVISFDQLNG